MVEKGNTERVCNLYVNNMHLIVMLIPYIEKELEKGNKIFTILEEDLENEVGMLMNKVNLDKSKKEKLKKINWKKQELSLNKISEVKNEIVLVKGSYEFVNSMNEYINGSVRKVINCFDIETFENKSRDILENHNKILNTLGDKEISDVFHTDMRKNIMLTK